MKHFLESLAILADALIHASLAGYGLSRIWHGDIPGGCILVCTSVVWQRAWKARCLAALSEGKP